MPLRPPFTTNMLALIEVVRCAPQRAVRLGGAVVVMAGVAARVVVLRVVVII